MIRWLTAFWARGAERRLGDFLLGVAAAGAVALSAPSAWGLALSPSMPISRLARARRRRADRLRGLGATAITIWAVAMGRRRARRSRLAAMASASASVEISIQFYGIWSRLAPTGQLAAAMRLDASFRRCSFSRWRSLEDSSRKKTREVSRFRIEATLANQLLNRTANRARRCSRRANGPFRCAFLRGRQRGDANCITMPRLCLRACFRRGSA